MKKILFAVSVAGAAAVGYITAGVEFTKHSQSQDLDAEVNQNEIAAKLRAAQKRIVELEKKLSAAEASNKTTSGDEGKFSIGRGSTNKVELVLSSNNDIVDEIKRQLPAEEFTKATNAISRMTAKLSELAKGRVDYLESIDTSRMTKEERTNHEKYIKLLKRREAISATFKGGIPNEKSLTEMLMLDMQMQPIAKSERSTLIREVARELGYKNDEVEVFSDTMNAVFNCTNPGGMQDLIDAAGVQPGMMNMEVQTLGF